MGQELTQVPCPRCGTAGDADPGLSRWQCTSCGSGYFLRRCSACTRVSYVDGLQGFRLPWPCAWCGHFNRGFSQNQDPAAATAAELAAELTRPGPPSRLADDGPARQAGPGPGADGGPPPDRPPADREPADRGPAATGAGGHGPAESSPGAVHPLPGPALPPHRPAYYPPARGPAQPLPEPALPAPGPAHPATARVAEQTRPGGRRARRAGLSAALAVACAAAATALLLTAGHPDAAGMPAARALAQAATTRPVLFTASRVASIDFRGVAGQLVIAGTGSRQVVLSGQVRANGGAPSVETRFDRTTGVLAVSVRCAPATQCTQDLRLAVPGSASTDVRQPGGRVVAAGLAGPLRITAANVQVSATGLRSADLTAVITNGQLSAAFSVPPRQVSISLASAQATVRLPASAAYQVTGKVTAGFIKVAVPQASDAARTVTARVDSGELELLPS